MIYSCTMFFNEFHLLDLKLSEELDKVDRFIIVESNKTHSNKKKNVLLEGKYKNKKIATKFIKNKFTSNAARNEAMQRDVALNPRRISDDDVIICCDIDEIIHKDDFDTIVKKVKKEGYIHVGMKMYYYKLNLYRGWWSHPFAVTGKYWKESKKTLTQLRHNLRGVSSIKTNGRHFSYLMEPKDISLKIKSFLHTNFDKKEYTNVKTIQKHIKNHSDLFNRNQKLKKVEIDDTYPKSILENINKWKSFIA